MNANTAVGIVDVMGAEVLSMLKHVRRPSPMENVRRECIKRVIDKLHDACQRFERDDAAEEHELLYMPLFDALALVTDSIRLPDIDNRALDQAYAVLSAVRQQSTTYCAEMSTAAE